MLASAKALGMHAAKRAPSTIACGNQDVMKATRHSQERHALSMTKLTTSSPARNDAHTSHHRHQRPRAAHAHILLSPVAVSLPDNGLDRIGHVFMRGMEPLRHADGIRRHTSRS